jgi:hypothetical protein
MINICKIYIIFSYDAPLDLFTIRVTKKNIYKLSYFNNHITDQYIKFKLLIIKLFLNKFNSKFMNIYEKEIYSNLILTIEHFTFYKKKIYVFNLGI